MPAPVLMIMLTTCGLLDESPLKELCTAQMCAAAAGPRQASCLSCAAGHKEEKKQSLVAPAEVSPTVEQTPDAAAGLPDQLPAQAAAPAAMPVQDEAAASSAAPVQQLLQEPQQQRRGMRAGLQAVRQQWPRVAAVWRRAYWVDFILSLKVLPLQVGCCD